MNTYYLDRNYVHIIRMYIHNVLRQECSGVTLRGVAYVINVCARINPAIRGRVYIVAFDTHIPGVYS